MDDLEAVRKVVEAIKDFKPEDQQRVFRWAAEKLGLPAPAGAGVPASEEAGTRPAPARPNEGSLDIRTFVASKRPQSDVQLAATVAYFFRFEAAGSQQRDAITADDLQDACRRAGRKRLVNPGQTLLNAASLGVLDRVERGRYAINAVGENLVAMTLPRETEVGATAAAAGSGRPRRRRARGGGPNGKSRKA